MEGNHLMVALNVGTYYSSCAYLIGEDTKVDPMLIHANLWEANPHQFGPMQTPTCLLLNSSKEFVAFGYEAEHRYAEAASDGNQNNYHYFPGVNMDIHSRKVVISNSPLSTIQLSHLV